MHFLIENWHLIPFAAAVLIVLIWEMIKRGKMTVERGLRALVVLFATFGVAWITSEYKQNERLEGNVDYFLARIADRADNAFAKEVLADLQQRLTGFKAKSAEALSENEVTYQTVKALKKTAQAARFIDHYILVWNSGHEYEWQENMDALRRGIEVQRVFVLSETVMQDPNQLGIAVQILEMQRNAGVRVSYALQRDLQRIPEYQRFADVDYALFDEQVLEKIAARASPIASPRHCLVWWDRQRVEDENPFPWVQGTGAIRSFDETGKAQLLAASRHANKSQP